MTSKGAGRNGESVYTDNGLRRGTRRIWPPPPGWSVDWWLAANLPLPEPEPEPEPPSEPLEGRKAWTKTEEPNLSGYSARPAHSSPPPEQSSRRQTAGGGAPRDVSPPPSPSSSPPAPIGWSVPQLPLDGGIGRIDGSLKSTDVCAFNGYAEARFIATLKAWLDAHPELDRLFVRRNMALVLGVSVKTVDRYIEKYTAELSPYFEIVGGVIRLKA